MSKLLPRDPLLREQIIGLLLLLVGLTSFAVIAYQVVQQNALVLLDLQLTRWFEARGTPEVTRWMMVFTDLHGTLGVMALSGLLAIWLMWQRAWHWLWTLLLCVGGGKLLNVGLKYLFQRPRPEFEDPLVFLTTYSFPSGHTIGATLFYGFLTFYLWRRFPSWLGRSLLLLLSSLLVAWVGLSRIYLGAHYLSDVIAAVSLGLAWLALVFIAEAYWRQRQQPLG
ncbi:phosphatase PAP2 family protein [Chitinimonas lacunae]|uniref:Phosphatase PAP2 family protein n=1 Tax=Chitinimonas lacunae TaxID=1963018 RepID=A0ABV8MMF1_9NEIS